MQPRVVDDGVYAVLAGQRMVAFFEDYQDARRTVGQLVLKHQELSGLKVIYVPVYQRQLGLQNLPDIKTQQQQLNKYHHLVDGSFDDYQRWLQQADLKDEQVMVTLMRQRWLNTWLISLWVSLAFIWSITVTMQFSVSHTMANQMLVGTVILTAIWAIVSVGLVKSRWFKRLFSQLRKDCDRDDDR